MKKAYSIKIYILNHIWFVKTISELNITKNLLFQIIFDWSPLFTVCSHLIGPYPAPAQTTHFAPEGRSFWKQYGAHIAVSRCVHGEFLRPGAKNISENDNLFNIYFYQYRSNRCYIIYLILRLTRKIKIVNVHRKHVLSH